MPDQSDPSMDALLKAYAEKRRKAAEPPLEIHPATRRLIQSEVAKIKGLAREWPASFLTFFSLWPRLGLALGLCALLGSLVWFLGVPHRPSGPAPMAKNTSAPAPDPGIKAPDQDQPLASFARQDLAEVDQPPSTAPERLLEAAPNLQSPKPTNIYSVNQIGYFQTNALPKLAGRFVRPSALDEKDGMVDAAKVRSQDNFRTARNRSIETSKEFRSSASQPNAASVLASFNVEQTGNRLKFIDADGSVYEGPFWPGPSAPAPSTPTTLAPLQLDSNPNRGLEVASKTDPAASTVSNELSAALIQFQVGGTNLTTRQYLTFRGSFTLASPTPAAPSTGTVLIQTPALPAATPAPLPAAPAPLSASFAAPADRNQSLPAAPPPRARIQGKARLGDSLEWDVQAVPQ